MSEDGKREAQGDFMTLGSIPQADEFEEADSDEFEEFSSGVDITKEWRGMPECANKDLTGFQAVHVHFATREHRDEFARTIGQKIGDKTRSIWFPPATTIDMNSEGWGQRDGATVNPKYPVYIISKGRWETRHTSKALERMGVPYHIVVEPQEYDAYAAVIDPEKILTLPFSNLGQGSIPARNWVWEHAISTGAKRHWIVDDNIIDFRRFHENRKLRVEDGATFRAAEDFVDRYTNVAFAGPQYYMFIRQKAVVPPARINTRIYSCILIQNDLPYRWRGRYNEDTDLSLRALKDGWCTVLFNAFVAQKHATGAVKGGNTEELYQGDGRLEMAKSLREQHPDVVKIVRKWGRWQHSVDYRPFKNNRLIKKPGVVIPKGINDYGMVLVKRARK